MSEPQAPAESTEKPPRSLGEVVRDVQSLARSQERVSVGDLVDALGRASVSALVMVPALLAATPLSGVPGLSAFCGLLIALIAGQAVLGRRRLWLPEFMLRRDVSGTRLAGALDRVSRITAALDRHTHERFDIVVRGLGARLMFALCTVGGLIMPFLELIPFSASVVAGCVTLISLAVLTLDGLVAIVALALLVGAGGLVSYAI